MNSSVIELRQTPGSELWLEIDSSIPFRISADCAGDMGPSGEPAPHRERVLKQSGFDPACVLGVRQTHSTTLCDLRSGPPEPGGVEADGMIFDISRFAAGVTVADCMPVLLMVDGSVVAALLHSGWKGTGIVVNAVDELRRITGASASSISAILGPCICGSCYAVPAERAELFRSRFGVDAGWRDGEGESYIDLRAANLRLLEEAGVARATVVRNCTVCDPRLGSYRRDGSEFRRMLAVAGPFGE